ncbi:MAG: NAD(P)-dependent alcohol dehydrogenase, partial [Sphingomonas sp.]
MPTIAAYGTPAADRPIGPIAIERRDPRADDVAIDILYCGVCHSDLHTARNDWGGTVYPAVPGHEIVGRVSAVGTDVTRFAVGDMVGVGCLVDSCQRCDQCHRDQENYCREGWTGTYNGTDRVTGETTLGGYSSHIVVREAFVLRVPEGLDPAKVGPLLCAGITTYSPLRHWNVGPGSRVGVVGLGGLGHMAVKFAAALGAEVTVFTTSAAKTEDAKKLGANNVVVSTDAEQMGAVRGKYDFILDTVSAQHDI